MSYQRIAIVWFTLLFCVTIFLSACNSGAPVASTPEPVHSALSGESVDPATTPVAFSQLCTEGGTAIRPHQTVRDAEESDLPAHVDIVEVSTKLNGEVLVVIMRLRDIPEQLPINEQQEKGALEYRWEVHIDIDEDQRPDDERSESTNDYEMSASSWIGESPEPPDALPIADFAQADVWQSELNEEYQTIGNRVIDEATLVIDTSADTLTLVGTIPGITEQARLTFGAIDAAANAFEDVECYTSTLADAVSDPAGGPESEAPGNGTTRASADAIMVNMQPLPQPINIAQQLGFVPAQGGAGTRGNCVTNAAEQEEPILFTHLSLFGEAVIDIAETVTICYVAFTPGPVEEYIINPLGEQIRTASFTIDPSDDTLLATVEASDFTALPDYVPGVYTVHAQTPDGEFQTTFELTDQIAFSDKSRTLQPLSSGAGARDITATEYIFATGFEPNETLDLFFYEECAYTGFRRDIIGRTLAASAQTQVNADGYIFARVSQEVREAVKPGVYFNVLARGSQAPSLRGRRFDVGQPFGSNEATVRNEFDGREGAFAEAIESYSNVPICPSPAAAKQAPAPENPVPVERLQRMEFQVISDVKSQVLYSLNPTNLFAVQDGAITEGNPTTAVTYEENEYVEAHPVNQPSNMLFTVEGLPYVATVGSEFMTLSGESATLTGELRNAAGEVLFTSPIKWNTWIFTLRKMLNRIYLPAVTVGDGVVYIGGEDRRLYAFDLATAAELWSMDMAAGASSQPVVVDGTVYVGDYAGYLFAVDAQSGKEQWRFAAGDWVNTPVVNDGTIYVTSENDYLYALDVQTGEEQWRYTPDLTIVSLPVIDRDVVYLGVLEPGVVQGNDLKPTKIYIDIIGTPGSLNTVPQPSSPVANFPEQELQNALASAGGIFGVVVYDVMRDQEVYQQNAEQVFSAASLIKIPIAVAAYTLDARGQINLDEQVTLATSDIVGGTGVLQYEPAGSKYTVRELCALMLSESDNTAANMVLRFIGGLEQVNTVMRELGLTQTQTQRFLMDLAAIEAGRDNLTSPADMALLLQLLAQDRVAGSSELIAALGRNRDDQKIPALLPSNVFVAHKTGTLPGAEHDVGLVTLPGGAQYIVVLMGNNVSDKQTAITAMAQASYVIYQYQQGLEP